MSFSATPAFLNAAITAVIRLAFSFIAALAVAACVITPAETMAISGARRTSPSALTSNLVPDICKWSGVACAWAADNGAMAAKTDMIGTLVLIRHLPDKRVIPVTNLPATSSEERSIGKECVSRCRSQWSPDHLKNKNETVQHHNT